VLPLARLSFFEHASLAAHHNGEEEWEYRRLDVFDVEASRHSGATRGPNIPTSLDWLDQQGLKVQTASRIGTTENVHFTSERPTNC
jgi:hypothetical protein